jgi:hypothetical protein
MPGVADVETEMTYDPIPMLAVGSAADFKLWSIHEQHIREFWPADGWRHAAGRDELFALLKQAKAQVVYFYCHGGVTRGIVPYLALGPANAEELVTRASLRFTGLRWQQPGPLIFINGCHTTALEPKQAFDFVTGFVEVAGASGVIGTEITVFERLACAFAEECLRRFVAGMPIGDAVRGARRALLKAGNPLGLVYDPFVIGDLHLVPAGRKE